VHHPFASFEPSSISFLAPAVARPEGGRDPDTRYRTGNVSILVDCGGGGAAGQRVTLVFRVNALLLREATSTLPASEAFARRSCMAVGLKTQAKRLLVLRRRIARRTWIGLVRYPILGTGQLPPDARPSGYRTSGCCSRIPNLHRRRKGFHYLTSPDAGRTPHIFGWHVHLPPAQSGAIANERALPRAGSRPADSPRSTRWVDEAPSLSLRGPRSAEAADRPDRARRMLAAPPASRDVREHQCVGSRSFLAPPHL